MTVRLDPQVKAALEKAAKSDARSVSSLIQKLLSNWLKEEKFLK
ncbi:MAG: ribbon-helix-helix protein, CopG family [Methylocella sp.]